MEAATEERKQEFDEMPADRVFYTLKLLLDEDGTIRGDSYYNGTALKALNIPPNQAAECAAAAKLAHRAVQESVQAAGQLAQLHELIAYIFGGMDDSEDSDEGSGDAEQHDASGDSEDSSVRPVGREEDATDRVSD